MEDVNGKRVTVETDKKFIDSIKYICEQDENILKELIS
jgi:hypothetical protein